MTHPRSSASIRRRLAFSTALATGLVATVVPSAVSAQLTHVGTINTTVSNGALPTINQPNGNTTTITVGGSRTIINWNDLNVSNSQTLNFVVGANTDAVLNRVLVGTTTINGNVSSYIGAVGGTTGGQIFILNPNGVIFGGGAVVNVGGLVAGTLGLTDGDFNNAGSYSFTGAAAGLLTVAAGANLSATDGPLVLVAGQLSNAGTLTSLGDVALVAASDVTMNIDPGSLVSMTIASGTTVDAALVAGGTISGRNVTMAVVGRSSVTDALLNVTGAVTATGVAVTDRGIVLTAGTAASGVTIGGGDVSGTASIAQSGALDSQTNVELRSATALTGSGAITALGNVAASAANATLGTITANGDVDIAATSALTITGAVGARDIALSSLGTVTTQNLNSRDDIAIRASGLATTGAIATGVTVNALAAVDAAGAADVLAGTTLGGQDLDSASNGFRSGPITTLGTGSDVGINGGAGGIGSGLSDLSITAAGNIQLTGQAKGRDVAMQAGGAISTGAIAARDDIVLRATGQILTGGLTSGTTVDASAPLDIAGAADALAATTLNGNDSDLAGDGVMVGSVRAIGAGGDIRIAGGASGIGNGGLDLDLDADQDITLTSDARGRDIALNANGAITTLNLDARDDVAAIAGTNLSVGRVRTGITVDLLPSVVIAGAADFLAGAQVPAVVLAGNSAYLEAGDTLDILTPAEIVGGLTLRADDFTGQGVFDHNVGTLLRVIDRTGDIVINDAVSETYGIALEAETGSIIVNNNIGSGGSLSLTAVTPGEAIRLDDFNLAALGSITLNGVTDVRDTVTIDAGTTATFNGAIIGDGQAGGSNDPDFLTIDSGTGTFFNGTVGSGTANISLQSLTVTGGLATLNAATMRTNAGIALAGLATGNQASVVINAGSGTLISTGAITASQAGTSLTLDGSSITVTDVGAGAFPFSAISFAAPTNLGGNVSAINAITFTGDLLLLDDGNSGNVTTRQISSTGTSAITFQEDISSQGNGVVGLAVSNPTGSVVFNRDVGLAGATLAALGIAAQTFDTSAVVTNGGKFRVGTLAINVAQGDIILPAEGALTIGTVGSIVGLSTLAAGTGTGRIEVSTPNGSDLTINGQVRAFGSVILNAGDDLLGSAAITAGFNVGPATSDVRITANDTVNTGSITAPDEVTVTGGGLVTTGAITSNSVDITGNGIRPGAITVQTSIDLDGGAGGIGDGTRDLSLSTPGSITLTGEARGIDIALSSTGGGTINTGALRARDDVVIGTTGVVSTGAVNAGVTVDSLAAIDVAGAGDTLRGAALVGNDVAISGSSIVTGAVRAIGSTSDIQFFNAAGGIGSSLTDLDLVAGGSITLPNVTALGRDIALSGGTSVNTGALTATDDVVIRAGTTATLGAVSATGGVDAAGAADTLAGRTLTGADADLSATATLTYASLTLGDDLTLRAQNVDAILLAPLPTVGGDVSLTDTGGGLTITSFAAPNGSLTIATENGNLSVGGVSAADNVNLSVSNGAAGELILTGAVTAGAGDAVSLVSTGLIRQDAGVITAASLNGSSVGATTLSGANVVASLAGFTANGLTLNVTGPLTIANAVNGGSALRLTAGGAIAINALTQTSGIMTLVSGGAITQTAAIEAAVLTGSSTGATALTNMGNDVDAIGSVATPGGFTSGGSFSLVTVGSLTVGKALASTGGGVSLDATGALTVNANVTGTGTGAINLEGNGVALAGGTNVSTGSGLINIDSVAAFTSSATISTVGAVTIDAVGDLSINGGSVSGTGVALNATGGGGSDILVNAAINGATGLLAIDAGGTVTSNAAGTLTTSGAGRVTVQSGGGMSLGGAIAAGSGGIALTSGGLLGLLANATAAGAGTVVIDSVDLMTLASGITVGSGSGAITLDSDAGLTSSATISSGGAVSATADGDLQLLAGSVTGNGVTLSAIGANSDVTLNAALSGGAGGVGVTAGGTIISNAAGTVSASGAGAITLDSNGLMTLGGAISGGSGAILLDSGGALSVNAIVTGSGSVTGLANGDLLVGAAITGNGITLTTTGAGSDATLNAALNGGAGGIDVTATGTIISNAAGTVTAGGAGTISLDSNGLMTIGGAISGGSGAILLDSGGALTIGATVNGGGSVTGTANGNLQVGGAITGNGVTLTATGANSDTTLNAAVNGGAGGVSVTSGGTIVSIGAGTVTATGAGAISLDSGGLMAIGGAISGGSGAILLDSGGALTTSASVGTGGSVTGTANGDLQVGGAITGNGVTLTATGAGSDATLNAALNGGAGGVSVTASGAITSVAAGTIAATGAGLITLDGGAAMTVGGAITGGTGSILLDSGGALTTSAAVGSGGSVTGLANGNILVGGPITGNGVALTASGGASTVTLNAPVNAGGGTLALTGPAGISQSAAGILTAGLLSVSSNGLVSLGAATNAITALGVVNTAGFALLDGGGLILNGTVAGNDGVSIVTSGPLTVSNAITTTNSAITLNAGTGALNLAAAINAGNATVDLRGATIGQTAGGIVTAGTLTGLSTGATLLDTAVNAVAALGDFSAERLALRNAGALAITGSLTATGAASAQPGILLTASGISQSAASLVDGGAQAIRLDANGGSVALAGTLRSTATGAAIAIVDAGAVSLGTVRAATGTLVLGETGATVGAVTQTGPIEAALLTAAATGSPITLANAANSIGALGPISASTLTLRDGVGGLDIAGNLRIAGTLDLAVPNGAITQSAGTIEATLLRGSSNGGATFTRTGNNIVALGPWTNANAGGFTFTSAFALSLAGDIAAGTGPLNLSALSLAGAGRTLTSGGAATLAATGGDLNLGTVTAGPSASLTATNAVIAGTVTAGAVTASGASVDIGTATASSGALALTATSGLLRLGTGAAGTTATLTKQGTTGQLEIGTRLSTQGNVSVVSATNARIAEISSAAGAIAVTASAGSVTGISGDTGAGARLLAGPTGSTQNLTVSATNWVRLGDSRGGVISATGARLELTGAVTGTTSILFDSNGTATTRLGSVADSDGFSLGQAEMDLARAPTVTIQSRANPIAIGDLTLSTATGATRLNILTSGRIDVTGRFQGGLAGRAVQLGGTTASNASGAATVSNASSILAVAATAAGGGRLLFEGSTLDLRAAKIGVGQDAGFLGADGIGLTGTGATPIVQSEVSRRFIGNSSSTLYRSTIPYSDTSLIKAGQISVTYADYAVFQNSALAGTRAGGVTLAGSLRPMLALNSSGATAANAFAMFAEIDGRFGLEAAVLPRTFVELNNVNPGNTRINGCLAGSAAGGCIINNVAPPLINVFDAGRADVLNAAGDLPIAFDPIVGANNESLFAGLSSIEDVATDPECKPDDKGTTCPAPERTQ